VRFHALAVAEDVLLAKIKEARAESILLNQFRAAASILTSTTEP